MSYAIDYTALADPVSVRATNPWDALKSCKPFRERPAGQLGEYAGSRYDLFTIYLPRRGISLQEPVKAYTSGQTKVIECAGRVWLTGTDGTVYDRAINCLLSV